MGSKSVSPVSFKRGEAELQEYAESQPGGFSQFVKGLIRAHRDGQQTLTLDQLKDAMAEAVTRGIQAAGGLPARQEGNSQRPNLDKLKGMFK